MKENLGQGRVKRGFLSLKGKIETILQLISLKNDSFSSFVPTFSFYSLEKFHNVIFKIVNLVAI